MTFDKPTIHNLAAEMFWRFADEIGVGPANERVLATEGRCIIEHQYDGSLWRDYPLASLADEEARWVMQAVAFEAFDFTRAQQNMIGQIYLEDRETGRSPSAANLATHLIAKAPAITVNRQIERLGRLCLRHPLPALVFATREPVGGVIQIEDTATALGVDLPMFVTIAGSQRIDDTTVILTGYFHIPVPDAATGDRWNHIIQNSTRAVSGLTISQPEGQLDITYEWDVQSKKGWSWFRRS